MIFGMALSSSLLIHAGQGANGPDHSGQSVPIQTGRDIQAKTLQDATATCFRKVFFDDFMKLYSKKDVSHLTECGWTTGTYSTNSADSIRESYMGFYCLGVAIHERVKSDGSIGYSAELIEAGSPDYGRTFKANEIVVSTKWVHYSPEYKKRKDFITTSNWPIHHDPYLKIITNNDIIQYERDFQYARDIFGNITNPDNVLAKKIRVNTPKSGYLLFKNLRSNFQTDLKFDFEEFSSCIQREVINASN